MVERELSEGILAKAGVSAPSLLRRFVALLVDWLACLLISSIFASPARDGWAPVAVLIAEYGFFLGLFGQTPGMFVARLRCVDATSGAAIGIPRALLRGILLALVVPALIMDTDRRGVHDRLANSVVIPATKR